MCDRCEKIVLEEQGILESDLRHLPFTYAYWQCVISGCRGRIRVKDYGNTPFFFDAHRRRHNKKGWRGGWFDATYHGYICGKHSNEVKWEERPYLSEQQLLQKVIQVKAAK